MSWVWNLSESDGEASLMEIWSEWSITEEHAI